MKKQEEKRKKANFSVKRSASGLGLFANAPFEKGDFVIEYAGKLLNGKEADEKGGRYLFRINSRWTIDGSTRKNLARYINHSCRPNCEPYHSGKKILIYAEKKIQPGQELTYNYGKEYFDEFIKPGGCRCEHCLTRKKKTKES